MKLKLKQKLLLTFLIVALTPTLILGFIASYNSTHVIEDEVSAKLIAVRDTKKAQLESYFLDREHDLKMLGRSLPKILNTQSLDTLKTTAFENQEYFAQYIKTYEYYDFFIIDNDGNVFYTVTKEADINTNSNTGPYKDSGLSRLFRSVKQSKEYGIVDFSRYAPSNDDPAAFIAAPLKLNNGQDVVIALQLSLEKVNHIMTQRVGMGETGESYLIGSDKLMRSDSFLDPVGHTVKASFAGNVANNGVDTEAATLGINGKTEYRIIVDYNGNDVLSAFTPLKIQDFQWVVISEIDKAEAFAPIYFLYKEMLFIIFVAIVLVLFVAVTVSSSILKPLGGEPSEMLALSKRVANGELDIDFDKECHEGSVYFEMQRMTKNLQTIISSITDESNVLASQAVDANNSSKQTTIGLQEQQDKIQHIATAVEEMTESISKVANNAVVMSDASKIAKSSSDKASETLHETIADLTKLDNEITQASEVIKELETDSHKIGSVLEVIQGIAEQTNLLALNAAIEAARAGETGRGFAVVADEVRNLASKTQKSTTNIEEMILKLQSASQRAVKVMVLSREICEQTTTNANKTEKDIEDVNSKIHHISDMTSQTANAVEQQSSMSIEISTSITAINDAANENTANVNNIASINQGVDSVADKLKQLISHFKL